MLYYATKGFMNLILAVIVDHAAAAREDDKEEAGNAYRL